MQGLACVTLVNMDPSLEQARQAFLAGIEQFERHDFEAAAALFEQALQLAPGRPSVLMNLGVSCVHLGRFERADVCLRQALAADDSQVDAWKAWGVTQMALGDWTQALHCHDKARALGADGADFCLRWGQCLAHQRLLPQALLAFEQALTHDPDLAEAWSQMAHVQRDMGQTAEAITGYQRAMQLGADPELHRYYLAALNPASTVPINQRCTNCHTGLAARNVAMEPAMMAITALTLTLIMIWVKPSTMDCVSTLPWPVGVMNWGSNDRYITATFGFNRLVTNPIMNSLRGPSLGKSRT